MKKNLVVCLLSAACVVFAAMALKAQNDNVKIEKQSVRLWNDLSKSLANGPNNATIIKDHLDSGVLLIRMDRNIMYLVGPNGYIGEKMVMDAGLCLTRNERRSNFLPEEETFAKAQD